ncbi:hypothetical protein ACFYWD_33630 [Streptomyces sp. NPDC003781]|uniref:hypothetical protein n=1 Tax=Streptomyces sp. NPDC003781 TaxID=3364686 RepID=UPI0036BE1BF9
MPVDQHCETWADGNIPGPNAVLNDSTVPFFVAQARRYGFDEDLILHGWEPYLVSLESLLRSEMTPLEGERRCRYSAVTPLPDADRAIVQPDRAGREGVLPSQPADSPGDR